MKTRPRHLATLALTTVVIAALVGAALLVTGSISPAVTFQPIGHRVFGKADQTVAHVDPGTRQVDARLTVPGADPRTFFALQGDKQGFLVGPSTVTVFGKSSLSVESSTPSPDSHQPVGIEVISGPYLVHEETGVIVRLGPPSVTVRAGGPLDRPTFTDDGTLWVHRPDTGAVCALRRDADVLDCPRGTAPALPGELTVATSSAAFLDTADDAADRNWSLALRSASVTRNTLIAINRSRSPWRARNTSAKPPLPRSEKSEYPGRSGTSCVTVRTISSTA